MIEITSHFVLLAPNLYSDRPLIRLNLSWDDSLLTDELLAGCREYLLADAESIGELDAPANVPAIVAGIATWLQRRAGHRVFPVLPKTDLGLGQAALFEWEEAQTGEKAGRAAVDLCGRIARNQPHEQLERVIRRFTKEASSLCLNPGLRVLLDAAKRRDVPAIRLQQPPFQIHGVPGATEVIQLGWGDRQVRCQGLLTDRVPKEAIAACSDPASLLSALAGAGLAYDPDIRVSDGERLRIILIDGHVVATVEAGTGTPVSDPESRAVDTAVRVAQAIGLPVAAVELVVAPDRIVVTKIDPQPALDALPGALAAEVAEAFLNWLYPDGPDDKGARIPLAMVTGTNGKTTTCHLLAHILKVSGHTVGLVCSTGAYVDGQRVKRGDLSSPWVGLELLQGRRVSAGVMEVARGGLLKVGLGVTGAAAGGCLRIDPDHLGLEGIDNETQMARVKALVLDGVSGAIVLAADSVPSLGMAAEAKGRELVLVTTAQEPGKLLEAWLQAGRIVHLRDAAPGRVIAVTDRRECTDLIPVVDVPVTMEGQAEYNVENATFAAAFALAMGCSYDVIRQGLRSFVMDWHKVPARLSIFEGHPFTVVVDYAHNSAGVQALGRYLDRAFKGVRRIGVITASDRRLDAEVSAYARACASVFDEFVCTEYAVLQHHSLGEGTALIAGVLEKAGIDIQYIHAQPVGDEAARLAMDLARPGDAVIMLGRDDDRVWEIVEKYPDRPPEVAKESA